MFIQISFNGFEDTEEGENILKNWEINYSEDTRSLTLKREFSNSYVVLIDYVHPWDLEHFHHHEEFEEDLEDEEEMDEEFEDYEAKVSKLLNIDKEKRAGELADLMLDDEFVGSAGFYKKEDLTTTLDQEGIKRIQDTTRGDILDALNELGETEVILTLEELLQIEEF